MRDIKQLHPELQAIIPSFLADCRSKGLIVGIGECYRTVEEQNVLYAKGRTTGTKGAIVTNCRGTSYSSPHQWGVAFDFFRNDGKGAFNDSDGFFTKVGAISKYHGLEWGGSWTGGWVDKPHMQLAKFFRDGTTKYLKQTYGTPTSFMTTWKNTPIPVASTPIATPSIFTKICVATTTDNLNLRSGESTSNSILTTIPRGASVTVLSIGGSWSKVIYNKTTGYCSNSFLVFPYKTIVGTDTTGDVHIQPTGYQFVLFSPKGEKPYVVTGTSGVFDLNFVKQEGNYFYYKLIPKGNKGLSSGIFTAVKGENTVKRFVAFVG